MESRSPRHESISMPRKSQIRSSINPSRLVPPLPKARAGSIKTTTVSTNGVLNPGTKGTRELHKAIAGDEPERIIARGVRRSQLDRESAEEDELSEDDDISEEGEEEDEEEGVMERDRVHVTSGYENFFQHVVKKKKSLTSNNTLSLLPTLSLQESASLLARIPGSPSC